MADQPDRSSGLDTRQETNDRHDIVVPQTEFERVAHMTIEGVRETLERIAQSNLAAEQERSRVTLERTAHHTRRAEIEAAAETRRLEADTKRLDRIARMEAARLAADNRRNELEQKRESEHSLRRERTVLVVTILVSLLIVGVVVASIGHIAEAVPIISVLAAAAFPFLSELARRDRQRINPPALPELPAPRPEPDATAGDHGQDEEDD